MSGNATVLPRVLMALGSPPLSEDPVWTDVSARFRSAAPFTRHLGDEGVCTLVLDNRDRALEPGYSGSAYYPDVKENVRIRLETPEKVLLSSELLTANQQSLETSAAGWYSPNATLARTTAQAAVGGASLQLTATAADQYAYTDPGVAVTPTAAYVFTAQVRAAAVPLTVALLVTWYTGGGILVATTESTGVTNTTSGWTTLVFGTTAPATATVAYPRVTYTGGVAGNVQYVDDVHFGPGTVQPEYVVFDGYIDSITPSYTLGNPGDAVVTVKATDITKILARYPMRSPLGTEIHASAPVHWWPMGEAPGSTVMGDSGSIPTPGSFLAGTTLGHDKSTAASSATSLLATDVQPGPSVGAGSYVTPALAEAVFPPLGTNWSWEITVTDINPRGYFAPVMLNGPGQNPDFGRRVESHLGRDGNGHLYLNASVLPDGHGSASSVFATVPPADEGQFHHIAMTKSGATISLYMDGALTDTNTLGGGGAATITAFETGFVSTQAGPPPVLAPAAAVSHVAVYDRALTAAEVLAHANAARIPWEGDSTGERIERLLDVVGIPEDRRDIDAGATIDLARQTEPTEGKTVLDLARQAENTEAGRMFARASGEWRFADRRDLDGTTPIATFGPGTGELRYADLVGPNLDEQTVVREATVTRQGGNPQTYRDPTIVAGEPVFGVDITDVLYGTDNEAFDLAAWLVALDRQAHPRYPQLVVFGERSAENMAQVAARDIGDKIIVKRTAPGGGAPQEATVVIVGVSHTITTAPLWHTTYDLAPCDVLDLWIIEDPVYGKVDDIAVVAF